MSTSIPERAGRTTVIFINTLGDEVVLYAESSGFLKSQGLKNRLSLPEDEGMLFSFSKEEFWKFWMSDTYIPLDIIFLGEDKRVVDIVFNAAPLSTDVITARSKAKYVIEVNTGWTINNNITIGSLALF